MTLDINLGRALRRPADLVRLVEAVLQGDDEDEADWVEWKSSLDLTAPEGTFSLARQILGLSHRHPDQAARIMQGLGYVIVGARPRAAEGVTRVDLARLDASLEKYLGSPGPVWSGNYVEVDAKDVLVVTVEAPQWGDRMYPLAKSYQGQGKGSTPGADAGVILVRKQARTVPAGPGDVQMLQNRLMRGRQEDKVLELAVAVAEPAEFVLLDLSSESIDVWLQRRREAVLAMEPPRSPTESGDATVQGVVAAVMRRDRRSREFYNQQVENHLNECREAIHDGMVNEAIGRRLNLFMLRVSNPTDRNLPDVELRLRIHGRVQAFDEEEDHEWALPDPPDAYGSPSRTLLNLGMNTLRYPIGGLRHGLVGPVVRYNDRIHIDNGPPTTIELTVGHVRPRAVHDAEPFLLVADEPVSELSMSWSATSTRVDARQEGEIIVPVSSTSLAPLDLISYD